MRCLGERIFPTVKRTLRELAAVRLEVSRAIPSGLTAQTAWLGWAIPRMERAVA